MKTFDSTQMKYKTPFTHLLHITHIPCMKIPKISAYGKFTLSQLEPRQVIKIHIITSSHQTYGKYVRNHFAFIPA